jgi:hypothetical protein
MAFGKKEAHMPGDSVGVRDTLAARLIRAIRAQDSARPLQLTDGGLLWPVAFMATLTLRESLITEKKEGAS